LYAPVKSSCSAGKFRNSFWLIHTLWNSESGLQYLLLDTYIRLLKSYPTQLSYLAMKTEAFLLVLFSVSQISTCSGGLWSLFGGSSSPAKKEESQTKVHRRLAPGVLVEKGHLKMDPKRERAMFDPEVASHEPDADLEYLGYDQDEDFDDDFDHYRYGYWGRFNATERLLEVPGSRLSWCPVLGIGTQTLFLFADLSPNRQGRQWLC